MVDAVRRRAIERPAATGPACQLDLRSAAARLQQSRAIRRSLGGDALPSVDASGNYQRQRTTSAGLFDPSGKAGKGNYNHALAGFDASWELDFWGRVRRELEAADATVEASENELRDVQVSVLAEAARDYIQLRGEQSRAAIIRDNLETARHSLNSPARAWPTASPPTSR